MYLAAVGTLLTLMVAQPATAPDWSEEYVKIVLALGEHEAAASELSVACQLAEEGGYLDVLADSTRALDESHRHVVIARLHLHGNVREPLHDLGARRALAPFLVVHPELREDFSGLRTDGEEAVVVGDAGLPRCVAEPGSGGKDRQLARSQRLRPLVSLFAKPLGLRPAAPSSSLRRRRG